MTQAPLPYQPSYEVPEEHEAETTQSLLDSLNKIGDVTLKDEGFATRTVHAKNHGLLVGELEVLGGLPDTLAQGLFAQPGTYPVVLRFSTIPGDQLHDNVSLPRGMALKVIGVPGPRLPGSEDDTTQDFILVDGPAFLAPGPKAFAANLKPLAASTDKAEGSKHALSVVLRGAEKVVEALGGQSGKLIALGGHPVTNLLGEDYFSQVPLLWGDYMAKVSVVPSSQGLKAHKGEKLTLGADHPDALREAVSAHFARDGAEWDFRVQLCTDLEKMPIEDASVEWKEADSPFVAVGKLRFGPQESWRGQASIDQEARMAFSVWHGIAGHRPIGAVQRVRKAVYKLMQARRARENGVTLVEPTSLDDLPR